MLVTVPLGSLRTGDTLAAFRSLEGKLGHPRDVQSGNYVGCGRAASGNHWRAAGGAPERSEWAPLDAPLTALVLRVLREAHFRVYGRP